MSMLKKLHLVVWLLLTSMTNVRADVGQPCPHLTLRHGYFNLALEVEKLLPTPSLFNRSAPCGGKKNVLIANYSPICEIVPEVPVVLMSAIASERGDLVMFKWHMPYSDRVEAIAKTLVNGEVHWDLSKLPDFATKSRPREEVRFFIESKLDDTYLIVSKEIRKMGNVDREFAVLNLVHQRDYFSAYQKIEACLR